MKLVFRGTKYFSVTMGKHDMISLFNQFLTHQNQFYSLVNNGCGCYVKDGFSDWI